MEALAQFIRSKVSLDDTELASVLAHFKEVAIKKDRFLLKTGHVATHYYFIKSGGIRTWFEQGNQSITAWLFFENDFFTELSSLRSGEASKFNIQAIADTTLLAIDKASMNNLYEQFPQWQRFGRLMWEGSFLKVIEGIINHQTMTAEERYLAAMERSDLLQKIPLKHLASLLGITPTSLSRIRKKIS